jgi:apolipoprotein N-acyltransferase
MLISPRFLIGATSYMRKSAGGADSFNSAFYIGKEGRIIGRYDKIHLVPFSEHVLLEDYIPFMRKIIPPVAGDFKEGEKIKLFTLGDTKFGVLICFEAIFGMLSRKFVKGGADFLVNITNDGWFGKASGPYQHFAMSRFRAVEGRVNLIRCANTGISAFIAPTGKVIKKTKLFEKRTLSSEIEIKKISSPYLKLGNTFAYVCLLFCIGIAVLTFRKRKY